jgi:hypothetical protein
MGIFTIGFNREVADKGPYYSVSFDWRERQSEEEKQQLGLISDFVIACGNQLIDLEAATGSSRCNHPYLRVRAPKTLLTISQFCEAFQVTKVFVDTAAWFVK